MTSNFPVETVDADAQFMEANATMFHVNDNAISVQITAGPEGTTADVADKLAAVLSAAGFSGGVMMDPVSA